MKAPSLRRAFRKVLLADIGGTNARFAVLTEGTVGTITHMAVSDHGSFREAFSLYLGNLPEAGTIHAAILAVSGTVRNGRCALTNNPWVVDAAELRAACEFSTVRLINDFEAVAWSLPRLSGDKLLQVGGRQPVKGAPLAALGPGTGLGMAANIPQANGHLVLSSEGGHSTLAGCSLREDAVINHLRQRFGHVSAERVLSGSGLENLHEALAVLDGVVLPRRRAAEITRNGITGTCATSQAAIEMFCAMLGTVAGNLALTLGAKGGVYIAGGILRHMPQYFVSSPFRARFEDKGRLRNYLEPIPVFLILDEDVAFVGLRALAEVEGIG
ncbi:glucokinase [Bradyrhizobium sp.]|uniref:glucokinase n=1 Tax=Bradyrhizobium sp. TaxID=376 RepID=UPI003C72D9F8